MHLLEDPVFALLIAGGWLIAAIAASLLLAGAIRIGEAAAGRTRTR